jgi:hypothetical protein
MSDGERAAAWELDDPDELRRSADEWEQLGYSAYADALRRWAGGDHTISPATLRPW